MLVLAYLCVYVWLEYTVYNYISVYKNPDQGCAADFSLLNLPKGKSLGRSKPATNS
jgi:hypothetical protein